MTSEKTRRSRCRAYNLSGTWISSVLPRHETRRHKLQIAQKQKINEVAYEQGECVCVPGVWDECHIWWPLTTRDDVGEVAWLHSGQIALQWKWKIFVCVSGQSAKCGSAARKKHKWLDDGGSASGRHWQWARQQAAKGVQSLEMVEETETRRQKQRLLFSLYAAWESSKSVLKRLMKREASAFVACSQ